MRIRSTLSVLVLGLVALAVGCGDDDSEATSSLGKAEFVKQANAICSEQREKVAQGLASYEEESGSLEDLSSSPQTYAETVQAVMLPVLEEEIERLRDLGAPAGDEERIEAMLDAQEEGIEEVQALEQLTPREGELESHFEEAREMISAYGLEACTVR